MTAANDNDIKKILGKVPEDKHFRIHMGTDVSSLHEMVEALEVMSDETFNHHVNRRKNDFRDWIDFVVGDNVLAQRLRSVKTREFTIKKAKERISELESNIGDAKVEVSAQKINKFGIIDFSIGVAVGIIIGILLTSI